MNKVIIILLVLVLLCIESFAQQKLAIIKDKDGYTNIRVDKDSQSNIIGKIKSDEFFYCDKSSEDWYPVLALQWYENNGEHNGEQIKGYVHKSRIQIIEELPINEQKKIIIKVLEDYQRFCKEAYKYFYSNGTFKNKDDSIKTYQFYTMHFTLNDIKYDPLLNFIPSYYCLTCDNEVLNLLFSTMWADKGTANEQPSFALGECYLCDDKSFLEQLNKIKNRNQLELLIDGTEYGLENHYAFEEGINSENITNKEYIRLSKQLEKLRK
jgi:hypothetical protein